VKQNISRATSPRIASRSLADFFARQVAMAHFTRRDFQPSDIDRHSLGQSSSTTSRSIAGVRRQISERQYRVMNQRTEVRLIMGQRALEFSRANPSTSPGYATAVQQLEEQLARANQLVEEQRRGIEQVRTATLQKTRYKRALRRSHLAHFAGVAERAATEDPALAQKFDLPRIPTRGLPFRAAARSMVELVEQQKELLAKYGLVEESLQNARQTIDQLDQAVEHGAEGRRVHIGASASLEVVSNEVVRLVKILDGFNRFRFGEQANLLAGWIAAANIIGPPISGGRSVSRSGGQGSAPGTAPEAGQVKPAA
jgi:flagellar biosynthesis chaperone FliJ